MSIDGRPSRKVIGLCVLVNVIMAAFPAGTPAKANESEQEERAHAVWRIGTPEGRARYEIEVVRASEAGEPPITTGFIATRICSPRRPGEVRTCISSADLKRVADDSLQMDSSMSAASFRMKFAGTRHGAEWQAESKPPEVDPDELAQREVSVERDAVAEGRAFSEDLVQDRLEEAGIERGATVDDSVPFPLPQELPARANSSSGSSTCWRFKRSERRFARAMNIERVARGLGKMRLDPELSKAARVHTREMTRSALLHHTDSDALRHRVTNWVILGENVGVGGTPTSLHAAFMASPAHKENILFTRFNFVGIGTARSGSRLWVTVVFETKRNPGTRLRMRKC